ncbi:unnamed protein product [Trifolium pratense]|uniref:Uncharacterized protein n=1 Tax=Trifolium pratense TaxID=57577 RepID=A0ACB0LZ65_TRIPR|nr:unnamed protein product [Trifolium pratense]
MTDTVYTKPFELVHTDLWGPAHTVSHCGYSYYIAFVDACTKYTWLYFLKRKSDALSAFTQFNALVSTQFQTKIKSLQSDWGGEYRSISTLLTSLGINHRVTCPHTSHQNGTVERRHRSIVEIGLTLLSHANMPLNFWDHSFTTAVFLLNRLPTASLHHFTSPYHALYNKIPDYSSIKGFGCTCFPHLRPYNSHKLDFRSTKCVYLGPSPHHKGYKCLSPDGRVYISKDVVFNELEFPYSILFPNTSRSAPTNSTHSWSSVIPTLPSIVSGTPPTESAIGSPLIDSSTPISPVPNNVSSAPLPISPQSPASAPSSPSPVSISPPPDTSLPVKKTKPAVDPTNTHPMVTRGKTGNLKPKVFLAHKEPHSVKHALTDPNWLKAMEAEYSALLHNKTWSLVPLPAHRRAIGCKWVFRIKENPDGSINKYKARLVAKGFSQEPGFDFKETFSPVVKPVTIRIILTLALSFKWDIQQIDINNAFLNGILQEEVYMSQPPGFGNGDKSLVCKLHKALYGLKQAPRAWYDRLAQALVSFGFHPSKCDPSLFVYSHQGVTMYVLVYVDDILLTGSSSPILHDLIAKLHSQFALKHMGRPDYFLGIEVRYLPSGNILLTQSKYIRDLLHRANMADAKGINTPMVSSLKLSKFGTDELPDPLEYRSIVGALQYVTLTRPDIAFCVNKVCQFLSRPLLSHWQAVKRILRYLLHTSSHGLLLQPSQAVSKFSIRAYSDSDWASDMDDRRSTSGCCVFFGPNLVSWSAKKQTLVARSSAEAEYRALAHTTSEIMWIQSLLMDLRIPIHTPALLCDNVSAVLIAHNPVLHARTKHLELDIHFVREKVVTKNLTIQHVPGTDQTADALTKPLPTSRFLALRDKLKVFDFHPPSA